MARAKRPTAITKDDDSVINEILGTSTDAPTKSTIDSERPLTNEVLPNEPTDIEVGEAAINAPSEFIVEFDGESYPLVELGFLESRVYANALLPVLEDSAKALLPTLVQGSRAWAMVRNFQGAGLENLRIVAAGGDGDLLRETLQASGFDGLSAADIEMLIASSDSGNNFSAAIGPILSRPAIAAISTMEIADLLMGAIDRLPEMATASLAASMIGRGLTFDRTVLIKQVKSFDFIALMDIALKQLELYKSRGRIRLFTNLLSRAFKLRS